MPSPAEGFASRLLLAPALRAQPDRRLVALVREGYEAAFEEIVRRYAKPLGRYASALVGARAEDVTQDAFYKALRALRRDDAEIDLRPWLYRIVRNTALNELRDRPPEAEALAEQIAAGRTPAEEAEQRDELSDLMRRLAALPEAQRTAIVMRELEGMSHEEIAAALGLSGGAVRQSIHRARRALRDGLGLLLPLPLLRALGEHAPEASALGAGAGGAVAAGSSAGGGLIGGGLVGGALAGGALKVGIVAAAVAGSLGAGVALRDGDSGRADGDAAAAAAPAASERSGDAAPAVRPTARRDDAAAKAGLHGAPPRTRTGSGENGDGGGPDRENGDGGGPDRTNAETGARARGEKGPANHPSTGERNPEDEDRDGEIGRSHARRDGAPGPDRRNTAHNKAGGKARPDAAAGLPEPPTAPAAGGRGVGGRGGRPERPPAPPADPPTVPHEPGRVPPAPPSARPKPPSAPTKPPSPPEAAPPSPPKPKVPPAGDKGPPDGPPAGPSESAAGADAERQSSARGGRKDDPA